MVGTAFRQHLSGTVAGPRRARLGTASFAVDVGVLHREVRGLLGAATALSLRQLLTAALMLAFVFGTIMSTPAAHEWFEAEPAASVQTLDDADALATDQKAPLKKEAGRLCTGHCVAHTLTLPASYALAVAPALQRAIWGLFQDQRLQAARPTLLDRPPRA